MTHATRTPRLASKACAVWLVVCAVLLARPSLSHGQGDDTDTDATSAASSFSNPQPVTVTGYSQDEMEPFLTRDGNVLFFNNSNAPNNDTNLFWATKVDDLTFQFRGEIGGVNSTALDAVASMDLGNHFFFVTTRSYASTLSTIYSGDYSNGDVTGIDIVRGVSPKQPGLVDFDQEISADGKTLYFTEGVFSLGASVPRSSRIMLARKSGSRFIRDPESAGSVFKRINKTGKLNYAPDTSADELEFFFTSFSTPPPAIYLATRTGKSKSFGTPQQITAATGFVEAPSISPDGKSLYFHKQNNNGIFQIYRLTRP